MPRALWKARGAKLKGEEPDLKAEPEPPPAEVVDLMEQTAKAAGKTTRKRAA